MWARRKRGGADFGIIEISCTKGRSCFEAFTLYLHPKNFQNEFHRSDYRRSRILDDRGIPPDSNQSRIPLRHEMLVGISPRWVVRLRGLAADQPLHIVNPARGLRVLLLLEYTGSLSAEETGGERVVPGKSQTQEIARPSFDGTETPSVPGPLLCQTNPPPNPVCTRKPCLAEPNPSPIRFCTGDHGLAEPNRNHRLAPHNSAKQTGARAGARRSPDQAAPRQSQDTHRGKLPPQLRQQTGAKANAGHPPDQAAPEQSQGTPPRQSQDTHRGQLPPNKPIRTSSARPSSAGANARHPTKAIARHPPGQAPAKQTHQDKQRQTKQRKVYKPKSPVSMETGDFSCRDSELLVAVL